MTTTALDTSTTRTKRKQPDDHKSKQKTSAQRREAFDEPVTFHFDGEDFTIIPSAATGLEFLAALEDERIIVACRLLLGDEQAARLFKGRDVEALSTFFDVMGEATQAGNR